MPFRAAPRRGRGDISGQVEAICLNLLTCRTTDPVTIHPHPTQTLSPDTPKDMEERAAEAAGFLKTLAHQGRLMILCHLGTGEKSVGELESLLDMRQAAVSQMLARLRDEGLVSTRREGKAIYYSLSDENTTQMIDLLYRLFCKP